MMIWPCVTALELDEEEGNLHIKAGLVCQYRICHRRLVEVVEDAYSVRRSVIPVQQELELPGILESKTQTIQVQESTPVDSTRLTDVRFLPQPVQVQTKRRVLNCYYLDNSRCFTTIWMEILIL